MSTQTVTLQLPAAVLERAHQAAVVLQQPVEEVLVSLLEAALPDVADAPPTMQVELANMTWLDNQTLWTIARSTMPDQQQEHLRALSEAQDERSLTHSEQQALEVLLQAYGEATLRKARAYALLSLRSGAPLLAQTQHHYGQPQSRGSKVIICASSSGQSHGSLTLSVPR